MLAYEELLQKSNIICHIPTMADKNITLNNNLVASL